MAYSIYLLLIFSILNLQMGGYKWVNNSSDYKRVNITVAAMLGREFKTIEVFTGYMYSHFMYQYFFDQR